MPEETRVRLHIQHPQDDDIFSEETRKAAAEQLKAKRIFLFKIATLTSLSLISLSLIVYHFSAKQQNESTRLIAQTFLNQTEKALNIWMEADINVARSVAEALPIIEALANPQNAKLRDAAQKILTEVHKRHDYYSVIMLAPAMAENESFEVTNKGQTFDIAHGIAYADSLNGDALGLNILNFEYGRAILENNTSVFVNPAKIGAINEAPVYVISARVEKDGKKVGMVAIGIKLDYFSERFVKNPGLGPTAALLVVDDSGSVVANSNEKGVLTTYKAEVIRDAIPLLTEHAFDFMDDPTIPKDDRQVMVKKVGRSPLATYGTSWYLLLTKDRDATFGNTLNILGHTFVGMTLFSVMLIFIIIYSLGNVFIRRIHEEKQKTEKANKELKRVSFSDPLTNLPNRRFFDLKLSQYAENLSLAVGSFDVDGLKTVNDMMGHQHGDALILRAARVLQGASPQNTVLCRVGGDEFVALYPSCDRQTLEAITQKIKEGLAAEQDFVDETPPLSISYGFALRSFSKETTDDLFEIADDAMYDLKRQNGQQVREKLFARLPVKQAEENLPLENLITRYAKYYPDFEPLRERTLLFMKYKDIGKTNAKALASSTKQQRNHPPETLYALQGFRMASLFPQIYDVARLILRQYERWDEIGKSPDAEGIVPLECRLVAAAEAYLSAWGSAKKTGAQAAQKTAFARLRQYSGTRLDPQVVERLIMMLSEPEPEG